MLLTRPEGTNARFADELPDALRSRLTLIDCPLMRITSLARQNAMEGTAGAIFTSSNGVRFAPPAVGRRAYCVGCRTTRAATEAGWQAVLAGQNAEELIAFIKAHRPAQPLYHFCGVHIRGNVVEELTAAGIRTRRIPLYDQILLPLPPAALSALAQDSSVIVPLFSPRAAAHFAAECPAGAQVRAVCLSEAVAEPLLDTAGFETVIAAAPTVQAMIECIEKKVETIRLG